MKKKSIMILVLLFMGYIFFIGALIIFAPKEELAKADWGATTLVYWLFVVILCFGIKMRFVFDETVHFLIEQTSKKLRE